MNPKDTQVVQRHVKELIAMGMVKESIGPYAIPAFLVPKNDGSIRMCLDSSVVSRITIKYRHKILRLEDILDELYGFKVFSKVDLRS